MANPVNKQTVFLCISLIIDISEISLVVTRYISAQCTPANASDRYPEWGYTTYEGNKADVQEEWALIRSRLKQDIDKIEFIDSQLNEGLEAFDAGDRDKGQWVIAAIYNLDVKKLR